MTQRSAGLKPWTVFYPVTVLGKVVSFDRFDVEEPTIAECLNGHVSFCGYVYVRFDGGFFVSPTAVDNWRAAHAT